MTSSAPRAVADPPLPAPFAWADGHVETRLPGGRVLFTSRRGGVSGGPFASLNLGRLTDDDPAHVDENRERVAARVGLPRTRFLFGRQVHGTRVRRAGAPPDAERPVAEEDGQATAVQDAAALVFVADCLPVALVAEGAVAAVHAGWKGLAGGILAEGVAAVRELGASGPVRAAIGPGAGSCCYEVGEEVHAHFAGAGAGAGARRGARLDLKAIAAGQLAEAGVAEVHDVGLCTLCAPPGLFFSHRRDGGVTGRQAGVVWRA